MPLISTADLDEFTDLIGDVAPGAHAHAAGGRTFRAEVDVRPLRNTALFSVASVGLGVEADEFRDYIGVTLPREGAFVARTGGANSAFSGDQAHILRTDRAFGYNAAQKSRVLVVNFFKRPMDAYLNRLNGGGYADGPGFADTLDTLDLSVGRASSFRHLVNYTWSEAGRGAAGAFAATGVADNLESALVSLFLSAVEEQGGCGLREDRLRTGSAARRRSEEFIEANLGERLTMADVAAAAGVPGRTLSRVFQNHHDLGVMAFVRARRLIAARRALQDAAPVPGAVTRIAMDCGFAHLGRFSAIYRQAFGETPSDTLRRR